MCRKLVVRSGGLCLGYPRQHLCGMGDNIAVTLDSRAQASA